MKKQTLTKSMLMTALICGFVQWGGTAVHAEELQEFTLDPMVVTAQRMETRDLDTPASTTVITAEEIAQSGAPNVDTLLSRQIGFNGMSYGPNGQEYAGSSSRTKIRGLDKGTLVMVNGAPMNLNNYNAISNIPLEAIERVEIVRGSNATLYGAEAMGGVINIITKKPTESKTSITGMVGNYTNKWAAGHENEVFSIYFENEYYDEVDPQSRKFPYRKYSSKANPTKETDYKYNYNTLGKSRKQSLFLTGNVGKNLTLNYNHSDAEYNRFQIKRSGSTPDELEKSFKYEDERDTASLVYDNAEDGLKSVLSFNRRSFDSNQANAGKKFELAGGSYEMYNVTSDTQKSWRFNDEEDSLIAGLAIKRDFFQNNKYKFQKTDRTSVGVYTSYTHQFDSKFSATLGLRGEVINDYDEDQNVFLPQFQTLYKMTDDLSWYTNVGKSFIMPAMNSLFSTTSDTSAHILKKSNGLKPQEGWTYETGLKKITDSTSTKLAIFNMDIENKFAWSSEAALGIGTDTSNNIQINKGDFRNTGVELEYTKLLNENWKYNLGVTYSDPEVNDDGEWVQDNAKFQFVAGVGYQTKKFNANVNYLFLGDRPDSYYHEVANNRYYALPDRNMLNANFMYAPDKNNSFALDFYNILDKDDVVNDYENYGLPFNWTLTYTHTF
ncbi:MAG: TonB-dependent receptor [Phascolarctobacterium sp.]|nr:TonB-dependent receptor [Phascolarctobacterium sp.]